MRAFLSHPDCAHSWLVWVRVRNIKCHVCQHMLNFFAGHTVFCTMDYVSFVPLESVILNYHSLFIAFVLVQRTLDLPGLQLRDNLSLPLRL